MRIIYSKEIPRGCTSFKDSIDLDSPFLDVKKAAKVAKGLIDVSDLLDEVAFSLVLAIYKQNYTLTKYKTANIKKDGIVVYVRTPSLAVLWRSKLRAQSFGNRLASEPANKLYPARYCQVVRNKLDGYGLLDVSCRDEKWMKLKGMGLVLAVGNSSTTHPPRFLIAELGHGSKTVCIVGKGVVFDSGGYDLKTSAGMKGMKHDKAGGSIAVAVALFFAQNPSLLPGSLKIVVIVPLVENLIGQTAQKVGDVHTSYNGKTVEVLNTDAEGRLILADALAYACDVYKPALLIDFATLTGWAGTLHCDTSYVYYTQNDKLASLVDKHGGLVGERSIRMPNWPEYAAQTRSDIADYKNFGFTACPKSGGFMATMFLSNFVEKRFLNKWIHFDVTHVENEKGLCSCNGLQTVLGLILGIV